MKRNLPHKTYVLFFLVLLTVFFFKTTLSQTLRPRSSSVLNTGDWYKFKLSQTGVYKLDFNFLTKNLNIAADGLNISTIGVFGYGGGTLPEENNFIHYTDLPENKIEVIDLNSNGKLEDGDYILFYADGKYRWTYNSTTQKFQHSSAFYSDDQYFFFTPNQGTNKRVNDVSSAGSASTVLNKFDDHQVYDLDTINPELSGRIWFSKFITNNRKKFDISLPLVTCIPGENIAVDFSYYSKINSASLDVQIGGTSVHTLGLTSSTDLESSSFTTPCPSSNIMSFSIANSISDNFYLDYVEVNTKAPLTYTGKQFNFRFKDGVGSSNNIEFNLSSSNTVKVWNVSSVLNSYQANLSNSGGGFSYKFNNSTPQEFVVFEDKLALTPVALGKIENQNLQDLPISNHIIITTRPYLSLAKDLANFHLDESSLKTEVLDIEKIYNEFSSGRKDITAIKRFLIAQFNKSSSMDSLRTVLFFGKACVDYKNILNLCEDIVPTYEMPVPNNFIKSFPTDDYFGLLSPNESNLYNSNKTLDIGIGRIPVSSLEEAKQSIEKIKKYKSKESYNDWRNQTATVSDDYDNTSDGSFYTQNEKINNYIETNNIKTNSTKIYLDAFFQEQFSGGQRYEDAEKLLKDNFTFGSLLISYIGHGGSANWAQERILSISDLPFYQNLKSLPFVTTATCGFAPYDKPNGKNKSAGEKFLLQKDGGAISLLTTCREVYISDQEDFMDKFIANFYSKKANGSGLSFGEISRRVKNATSLNENSQKLVLLGDPALTLNLPQFNVTTTKITNGSDDTLKSLSRMTIDGEVRGLNNLIMTDFNGYCQVTVFDKKTINKLNYNDGNDTIAADKFQTQTSRIFKGSTEVKNGKFRIQFIVPKDINYAIGRGKISYYAADINQKPYRDASGMDSNVWVGGANLSAAKDNDPPIVKVLMNDDKFAFGGMTNSDPKLFAKIFDSSGINTTGAGIGHDITAILDNNIKIPVILNNYYQSDQGNYRSGRVLYPFYSLANGKHTIKVKAWDVYNNPGEGYTEFIVAKSEEIAIKHVLNYPNPFTTNTWFEFEHNRPNEALDVSINVMSITGKVVKRIHQKITTDGFRASKLLPWNGKDDYGDPIGKGVYVYVVTIRDTKGATAYQYEKLVLLQ